MTIAVQCPAMHLRAPEPADAPAVLDLIVARDIADLGRPDYTLEDVQADWAAPGIDVTRDAWIAEDDDVALGYALLDDRGAALITVPPANPSHGSPRSFPCLTVMSTWIQSGST